MNKIKHIFLALLLAHLYPFSCMYSSDKPISCPSSSYQPIPNAPLLRSKQSLWQKILQWLKIDNPETTLNLEPETTLDLEGELPDTLPDLIIEEKKFQNIFNAIANRRWATQSMIDNASEEQIHNPSFDLKGKLQQIKKLKRFESIIIKRLNAIIEAIDSLTEDTTPENSPEEELTTDAIIKDIENQTEHESTLAKE